MTHQGKFLTFGVVALVLLSVLLARATLAVSDPSGDVKLTSRTNWGSSFYTIHYAYPSSVQVGRNLSIQLTLTVTSLTNLESYLFEFEIVVMVSTDPYHVATGSFDSLGIYPVYPGGHYGPFNISVPITQTNTGVGPGDSKAADVAVLLNDDVEIGPPINNFVPENSQGAAGQVQVQGQGGSSVKLDAYFPYLLLLAGIGLVAIVFLTRPRHAPEDVPGHKI